MNEKLYKQSIERLDITSKAIDVLKENEIKTIGDLCKNSKADLKKFELLPNEVKKIEVEMQLLGLNLKNSL